jgi:uncharacterized protein YkwD
MIMRRLGVLEWSAIVCASFKVFCGGYYPQTPRFAIQSRANRRSHAELRLNMPDELAKDVRQRERGQIPMDRRTLLAFSGLALVAACTSAAPQVGADGRPLPQLYVIKQGDTNRIYFNLLDAVNSLRSARSLPQVQFNAELNAAASAHSRDMSIQNRPWHFGSDGSSPLTRVQRVGYKGRLGGELISETYETELQTLSAWMANPDSREVILDPTINELGFSWWQEPNGKIWWTLMTGNAGGVAYQGVTPAGTTVVPTTSAFGN